MLDKQQLAMAEQQFYGYACAKSGCSSVELVIGMGLTKEEWEILRGEAGINVFMPEWDYLEIEKYFEGGVYERSL